MSSIPTDGGAAADSPPSASFSGLQSHPLRVAPGDIAAGVIIGRAAEYFHFFVFAIASVLVFPAAFFPFASKLGGMLDAFTVFSFAFVARPIGTVLFMAVQRRFGRVTKLALALLIIGASTVGIAFLPDYAQLGGASIILLSLFRIGQGVALGGSWDGLPSLLALHAPPGRRGWYAMLGQLGAPAGFIIAAGLYVCLLTHMTATEFMDWGWRFPFLIAFAINIVALFARLLLISEDDYERLLAERALVPIGAREVVRERGRTVLIGALAALASYALFHVVTVFPLSWAVLAAPRSAAGFLVVQMIGAALAAAGIVVSGMIADRIGRRTTLALLACLIALFSTCIPMLLNSGTGGMDMFILLGFILLGLSHGQASGAVSAHFPAKYRYTGAALTADLGWLAGAGFAPLVTLGLSAHFGLAWVSLYLLSGAICTLAALSLNRLLEFDD